MNVGELDRASSNIYVEVVVFGTEAENLVTGFADEHEEVVPVIVHEKVLALAFANCSFTVYDSVNDVFKSMGMRF